ncbi:lanthionine synthetase C family protein [Cytobacillus firmus]|uniref:lanthionine synthetase C family protein n=1 Tax=Cytobacillus firmus TaxID=1399 RepID=UPI0024945FED|nr:lanthionine synthetase C family protein [Cytobacillus firmus]
METITVSNNNLSHIIDSLVDKFSEPDNVSFEHEQNDVMPWNPLSLSHGYPGLIVLFSELDRYFPDMEYSLTTHKYMIKLKELVENNPQIHQISLFNGFTGVNFAVRLASHGGTRYSSMVQSLEEYSLPVSREFVKQVIKKHSEIEAGAYEYCYDLITGITGIGRYALSSSHPGYRELLSEEIIPHLIKLTRTQDVNGKRLTGFYSPPETIIVEEDKEKFTKGYVNLGLSHGIAGPLSLLSLAKIKGMEGESIDEAIRSLFKILADHISYDNEGPYFKRMVGLDDPENHRKDETDRFDAWCYGSFGVCRAIDLAYEAVGDLEMKRLIRELTKALITMPISKYNIISPILCHGYSGNLHILNRLLNSSALNEDEELLNLGEKRKQELISQVLRLYDSNLKYGYADLVREKGGQTKKIEKVGLLEGTVGILLSLISAQNPEIEPYWDEFLLLS